MTDASSSYTVKKKKGVSLFVVYGLCLPAYMKGSDFEIIMLGSSSLLFHHLTFSSVNAFLSSSSF